LTGARNMDCRSVMAAVSRSVGINRDHPVPFSSQASFCVPFDSERTFCGLEKIHSYDEAFQLIQSHTRTQSTKQQLLVDASNQVLASDALAIIDVPPFRRAMMDGYAIHTADATHIPCTLEVTGQIAAGAHVIPELGPGQSIRVMTGAPVPSASDAVIRQEWCEQNGDTIRLLKPVTPGESIQPQAEDGCAGQVIVPAGYRLTPATQTILQSFGVATVSVHLRPRVTLLITGNELIGDANQLLLPGQIYGSNDVLLASILRADGADVVNIRYLPDEMESLITAVSESMPNSDYIIMTGGVSVGDYDYVPEVLRRVAKSLQIRRILMRPGSPFIFATTPSTLLFGLSGNPAACFVQFETLVRPSIQRAMGLSPTMFSASAHLQHDMHLKPIKHTRFLRAKAHIDNGTVVVCAEQSQSPGIISNFLSTNCLIRFDGQLGQDTIFAGDVLPMHWI